MKHKALFQCSLVLFIHHRFLQRLAALTVFLSPSQHMLGQYLEVHCDFAVTFLCPLTSTLFVAPVSRLIIYLSSQRSSFTVSLLDLALPVGHFHFTFTFKNLPPDCCTTLYIQLANIDYKFNNVLMSCKINHCLFPLNHVLSFYKVTCREISLESLYTK